MSEETKPTFKRPDEQEQEVDPFADQRNYFAYWNEKHRLEREAANESGLSIYEQSRIYKRP
jgi:hypothetical protein